MIYIVMPVVILLALAMGIALPFIADGAGLHPRSSTSAKRYLGTEIEQDLAIGPRTN